MKQSKISECHFRSEVEREHAYFLEYEKQMGRVKAWQYEVEYPLIMKGKTVGIMLPDFTVYYPNGRIEINEIKGGAIFKDEKWRLQKRIFEALYPHIEYRVFDKFKKKNKKSSLKTYDRMAKRWIKCETIRKAKK